MKTSVESKIEEIAAQKFQGYSFVFDDWGAADRALDKMTLPAILSIMPVSGSFTIKRGMTKDNPSCLLVFIDKVKKDANGSDNEEVYERMKDEAKRFIREINSCGYFEAIDGDVPYSIIYEKLSCIVSGIALSVTLKEVRGVCL
jgi:hypothetical protein